MKRKIAAIMAADVVGYSRMIADDEEETLRRLLSYREVFVDFVTRGGGRIFNTAGDAVFAEFPSAVDALRAAIEIQESIRTRNLAFPESRHMRFRIGMSLGDVVERDGDLLGDGVNIAARLEGLAAPGGICLSRAIHEQVGSKLSVTFRDIGPQSVKNIPTPVHAFTIPAVGLSVEQPQTHTLSPRRARRPMLVGLLAVCAISAVAGSVLSISHSSLLIVGYRALVPPQTAAHADQSSAQMGFYEPAKAAHPATSDTLSQQATGTPRPDDRAPLYYGTNSLPKVDAAPPVNMPFDVSKIPFVTDADRAKMAAVLTGTRHQAVALGSNMIEGWSWNQPTVDQARSAALQQCFDLKGQRCRLYALDNAVVWPDPLPDMPPEPWIDAGASRTPFVARRIGRISEAGQARLDTEYVKAQDHKALAVGPHAWHFESGMASDIEAERLALEACGAAAGVACRILAVGGNFVVAPGEPASQSAALPAASNRPLSSN